MRISLAILNILFDSSEQMFIFFIHHPQIFSRPVCLLPLCPLPSQQQLVPIPLWHKGADEKGTPCKSEAVPATVRPTAR